MCTSLNRRVPRSPRRTAYRSRGAGRSEPASRTSASRIAGPAGRARRAAPRADRGTRPRGAWRCRAGRRSGHRATSAAATIRGWAPSARRWGRAGHVSSPPHLPGDGLAAAGPVDPATNDGREQTRAAAGMYEQEPVVAELRHGGAGEPYGQALGDAARAADHLVAVELEKGE